MIMKKDYEHLELSEEDDEILLTCEDDDCENESSKEMTFDDFINKQFDFMATFSFGLLLVLAFIIYLPFLLLSTTGFAFYKMFKKVF
ncbi:TPA: hypothetical protein N0J62_004542 [Salmonella enterica subsp. enterica serovar Enteritidis]|uniref:Uncharacterized protein n=2 Tax=Enterobacterales TaxID=91347 RepID=A0A5U8KRW9_SALEN|nr:hypothetical protein C2U48_32440 [Escherichia coli]EAA5366808.1 hypothetical protein [Salmonella enterica subsp. enterica serovar Enteritidis]EAQ6598947.1 hypothetical protein [Salmonella enterica]EAW0943894.1 hypothetical protein [Salmonella enterica subsp. enterica serovar Kentucky]EBS3888524.1 hypothetical protein [Salmonella enterica subsp. enterica serovar Newport]EBV4716117.1 hypothetical protein [Salmonella enterica subsp. enterica serovar Braenderup]EBW6739084.1 hypothetical protei